MCIANSTADNMEYGKAWADFAQRKKINARPALYRESCVIEI